MKQRRFLALIAAVLMLLMSVSLPGPLNMVREAEASSATADPTEKDYVTQGQCGDKLYWEFNTYTGELTITGSGPMYAYDADHRSPWAEAGFAGEILSVSLPKSLTEIGSCAFAGCSALTAVSIPGKVKIVGPGAFDQCESLVTADLPKTVTRIGEGAFNDCAALKYVNYQGKVEDRVKIAIFAGNELLIQAAWTYSMDSKPAAVAIKTQPKDIKVDEGKTATFKTKAVGAYVIRWGYRLATESETVWHPLGVTGESLVLMGSTDYDVYLFSCRAYADETHYAPSREVRLIVKRITLAIKTQPKTVKVVEGKKATFKVKTAGATSIVWQAKWRNDSEWYTVASGVETYTIYYADTYDDDLSVRCVISNDRGDTIYSNVAKLYLKLSVKTQPKSVIVGKGGTAYFNVYAPGATDYQWEYKYPGYNWTTWSGVTGSYFSISGNPSYNGLSFRCKVSNASASTYTKAATLTVDTVVRYRALLVGESTYSENALPGCVYNASSMAGMLKGLKNSFTTTTLKNATKSQIMSAIQTAFAGAGEDDVSLFFYSGHGYQSSDTSFLGALCPIDKNGITFEELATELGKVNGRVIVILDSCHSGAAIGKSDEEAAAAEAALDAYNQAAINAFAGYRLEGSGAEKWGELAASKFIVMTAAGYNEECWNTLYWSIYGNSGYSQGLFSAALLKGMGCTYPKGSYSGSMPADSNKDKLITLGEIYDFAYYQAIEWNDYISRPRQHMKIYGNTDEVLFRRK